ncbi:MAG: hypothetical protein R3B96_05610 [Pirellulaceae bacterium]
MSLDVASFPHATTGHLRNYSRPRIPRLLDALALRLSGDVPYDDGQRVAWSSQAARA